MPSTTVPGGSIVSWTVMVLGAVLAVVTVVDKNSDKILGVSSFAVAVVSKDSTKSAGR